MVRVCAWCQKYLGSIEPFANPSVSHGICSDCVALEIAIVVDRRGRNRRESEADHGRPVAYVVDRRGSDRRRAPSLYLV